MAQQVQAAISALYISDDASVRNSADRWLEAWQGSPEAWTVANSILHDPASGAECAYFCAQTLKTKAGVVLKLRPGQQCPEAAAASVCRLTQHRSPHRHFAPACVVDPPSATTLLMLSHNNHNKNRCNVTMRSFQQSLCRSCETA